ncbi:MAG: RagB/SusD family nutrient uptake outer membrane protein [Saprospiraceae bacterium]|nr:RagB/SusD family nutrient uptake outer membrane protein [Saprospiraceae bacterium]
MKKIYKYALLAIFGFSIASCSLDPINNPNGPTVESYAEGATNDQLQLLATGLEASLRNDMEFYYQTVSIVGREYYDLNATDPRYTGELLGAGAGEGVLDDNGFLTTRSFGARYRSARNAQGLLNAVANSEAGLDAAGIAGYNSFAKTCMAYNLLFVLNRQYQNGIRVDIADPDNLGGFVSYDEGLTSISGMLDDAIADAGAAGGSFSFSFSSGFDGFDTPSEFVKVIQGLKARVEMYRGNKDAAKTALNASFMDMAGDMNTGVYHVFSGAGNDRLNPLFYALDQNKYMAHPSFLADAEEGDARIGKVVTIEEVTVDELTSSDQVQLYTSNTAPVAIIRNEELILLMAEANIGSNTDGAVGAINTVRAANGLGDYSGATDDASLEAELLKQRRYSLFGEGHRWIDMRRYGKLGDLPLDREGDQVFEQFPRPVLEEG